MIHSDHNKTAAIMATKCRNIIKCIKLQRLQTQKIFMLCLLDMCAFLPIKKSTFTVSQILSLTRLHFYNITVTMALILI